MSVCMYVCVCVEYVLLSVQRPHPVLYGVPDGKRYQSLGLLCAVTWLSSFACEIFCWDLLSITKGPWILLDEPFKTT